MAGWSRRGRDQLRTAALPVGVQKAPLRRKLLRVTLGKSATGWQRIAVRHPVGWHRGQEAAADEERGEEHANRGTHRSVRARPGGEVGARAAAEHTGSVRSAGL